ncbi:MAG: glycosyltransferase family 2 protein [Solirubrobacteraceae bacterium]
MLESEQDDTSRQQQLIDRLVHSPAGLNPVAVEVTLSVVVPVYGCRSCLIQLHERVGLALKDLVDSYEIVLVDDCAGDGAWDEIERLVAADPRVRGIRLSRNFGQHAAITAGLAYCRGAWAVVMDCDLQDPPEDIPRLYAEALSGYDVVFGERSAKPTGQARRTLGKLYFWGLRNFAGTGGNGQYGTFSVISRKVIDAFLRLGDHDRHYLMVLTWLGFRTTAVRYTPMPRYEGHSSYSFKRLIKHALDGVFFQTTVLLRWVVYLGFFLAAFGITAALYLVGARVVGQAYPGWTSIVVLTLVLCGFIILSTGITGLYVGKVFDQSRGRPIFVVDQLAQRDPTSAERARSGGVGERASTASGVPR